QKKGNIVKTMEQPRDLQVGPEITQYGALSGDMAKTADMLLLVRPDFTIYDELRKTSDFKIFSDMRLAGVGLLGIVHATQPIDAVHRFITRIELGMIPQVIDTIIFVHEGAIKKVYTLRLIVRTPNGMTEADLARPLVEVIDFETGTLEYEIYTYGEQTVVMPVKTEAHSAMKELAESRIKQILGKYIDNPVVEVVSDNKAILKVQEEDIARIIGKGGKTISELEKKAGIHISVEPVVETLKKEISFKVSEAGGYLAISVGNENIYKDVDVYRGEDYVLSATVGKKSTIKVKKNSQFGKEILKAAKLGNLRVLAG
ncbi:MAG: ATPase, partial [Candidatus Aenigmarchaeota archaeon]|nr:ATPase [Candidatus Aenigmarchaeota archaeon]